MYNKIVSRKEKLTVEKAGKYLEYNTFSQQRKLRDTWVDILGEIVREGLFTIGNISVALYKNGSGQKERYLVNGQHQANMVLKTGVPVDVIYEEYDCNESMEDVSLLYRQFDNHAGRSLQNKVKIEMAAQGIDWPDRIASLVVSAAALNEGIRAGHGNKKVELLKKYREYGNFINSIFVHKDTYSVTKENKHLARASVAHAMIMTYDKCHEDSENFWEAVRDGDSLPRSDSRKVLRDFLMSITAKTGRGASYYKNFRSNHEITSKCITAWNAFRIGTTTQLKYFCDKQIPRAI